MAAVGSPGIPKDTNPVANGCPGGPVGLPWRRFQAAARVGAGNLQGRQAPMVEVHAVLGPLVFAVSILRVLWTGYRAVSGRVPPGDRILAGIYTGLFDLQVLVGVLVVLTAGLSGVSLSHPLLMVAAAVIAHIGVAGGRKPATSAWLPFLLALVSTALVAIAYPKP